MLFTRLNLHLDRIAASWDSISKLVVSSVLACKKTTKVQRLLGHVKLNVHQLDANKLLLLPWKISQQLEYTEPFHNTPFQTLRYRGNWSHFCCQLMKASNCMNMWAVIQSWLKSNKNVCTIINLLVNTLSFGLPVTSLQVGVLEDGVDWGDRDLDRSWERWPWGNIIIKLML